MSELNVPLMQEVLRQCEATEPEPWFPNKINADWSELKKAIERLWQDGLIDRTATENDELAFVLTQVGYRHARSAESWEKYRLYLEQEQNDPHLGQRRRAVRETLSQATSPFLARWLLWINLIVAGYGLYLCSQTRTPFQDFFIGLGRPNIIPIVLKMGGLSPEDVVLGKWWRLLTSTFAHVGGLHLLMNGLALYYIGRDLERMWGWWRFLLIYLTAGIGGSCLGIYTRPDLSVLAGASGAICGLLSAELIWLLGNRRYLPRGLVGPQLFRLFVVALLMTFISMHGAVSGGGHLGGAIVGFVVALLLHHQRFNRYLVIRALCLLLTLSVPVLCVVGLQRAVAQDPGWERRTKSVETKSVRETFRKANVLNVDLRDFYWINLQRNVLRKPVDDWNPKLVQQAVTDIDKWLAEVKSLLDELDQVQDLRTEQLKEGKKNTKIVLEAWIEMFTAIRQRLEQKRRWSHKDEQVWENLTGPEAR